MRRRWRSWANLVVAEGAQARLAGDEGRGRLLKFHPAEGGDAGPHAAPVVATFLLVDDDPGRDLLLRDYEDYVDIARRAGAGVQLETPTWRASSDLGARLGYSAAELRRVNRDSVVLLEGLRDRAGLDTFLVSGLLGPRGDRYVAGDVVDPDAAASYHAPQIEALAEAGDDLPTIMTLTGAGEAIGVVRAARAVGLPVAVSFTVEQDGRLPDGTALAAAITEVDAEGGPDYFMVNCAHRTHIAPGLTDSGADGEWCSRIVGLRVNASTRSHAELDAATELDEGDPTELAAAQDALRPHLPNLALIGGCCGPTPATSPPCGASPDLGRPERPNSPVDQATASRNRCSVPGRTAGGRPVGPTPPVTVPRTRATATDQSEVGR